MGFGERVRELLKARELKTKEFAQAIEENATSVTSYLNGNRKPKVEFIYKVIEFFPEADLNWLFRDETTGMHQVNDDGDKYKIPRTPENLVSHMEETLKELKALLSQK